MSRTPILILSLIAAFSASGLPLGLLQVGVWANMFDEFYEETNSVASQQNAYSMVSIGARVANS